MMPETDEKPLGEASLTALVVASMVGSGAFVTSGYALADLKEPWLVMVAWAVGGVIALCGAKSYGLLVTALTESGGEYLFLSRLVHPAAGFLGGWVSLLAGFTGAGALAAMTFESYALSESLRPAWLPDGTLAIALVLAATLVHAFRTKAGARGQTMVVVVKLTLLAAFVVWGFWCWDAWKGGPPLPLVGDDEGTLLYRFATTVMWISLSYSGFNAAVYVASEARGGAPAVSRAMVRATAAVTVLYLLLNAIFLFGPTATEVAGKKEVAIIAAQAVAGPWFAMLARVAISIGLASSVSSVLMAGPRVYAKMAQDGLFPKMFGSDSSPPTRLVVLQGVAIAIVVLTVGLPKLLSYLGLTLSLSAAATVSTLFGLKALATRSGSEPPWGKSLAYPVVPAIYIAATLVIAAISARRQPGQATATLVTFALGFVAYLVWQRVVKNGRPTIEEA